MKPIFSSIILAATLAVGCAGAKERGGTVWMQNFYDTAQGRSYTLAYAIPQTDAWHFIATCEAAAIGPQIPITLAMDYGDRPSGAPLTVNLEAGSFKGDYAGFVSIESSEFAGILINVGIKDPFWSALAQAHSLSTKADGREITVPLEGVNVPLKRFLSKCAENFKRADAVATAQTAGPFTYRCENSKTFQATFDNAKSASVAHITVGGRRLELHQVESGSGNKYVNDAGTLTLQTKENLAVFSDIDHVAICYRIEP